MSKLKYADSFVEYVLEQLDPPQHRELELHLTECEECRQEVEATRQALFSLPLALEQVEPPPKLRDRIVAAAGSRGETTSGGSEGWKWTAIAASIAAAALGAVTIGQYDSVVETRALVEQMQVRLAELEDANSRTQASLEELIRPGVILVELGGTDEFPQVAGNVFVEPGLASARIFIHDLPEIADEESVYQLWVLIEDGDPVPSDTFVPGGVVTEIETQVPESFQGFATTIEPAGGSQEPTGPMVVVGTL